MSRLQPIGDNVIVEAISLTDSEQFASARAAGLVIPETSQEKINRGFVVAVGDGRVLHDGRLREIPVAVGDEVLFALYGGTPFELSGVKYLILSIDDILGKIMVDNA